MPVWDRQRPSLPPASPKIVEVTRVVEKEKEVTKVVKQVVKETVMIEGTPQVIEKEVTRVIEKVATPVPEEITLQVWNIWGGTRVPMMEDMFKRFSEVHPGITVENVLSPGGERPAKDPGGHRRRHAARCAHDQPDRGADVRLAGRVAAAR